MFGDLGKIMKIARDMKEKAPAMRAELESRQFAASAGGGAVAATVSGKMELIDLTIVPSLLDDGDAEMLADLVKAAVSAAQGQARQAMAKMMQELTGGVNLPGMEGLDGLLG
jgi:DNA-binding YbaB/EbfC family protein